MLIQSYATAYIAVEWKPCTVTPILVTFMLYVSLKDYLLICGRKFSWYYENYQNQLHNFKNALFSN